MAFNRNRMRRLGSVRHSVGALTDSIPKFPPLSIDKGYELHGAALAVPPTKDSPEWPDRHTPKLSSRGSVASISTLGEQSQAGSSRSTELEDLTKQHHEALIREQKLQETVASLQSSLDCLQSRLETQDATITDLQHHAKLQEAHYKQLYEQEVRAHSQTHAAVSSLQSQREKLEAKIAELQKQHVRETMETKMTWEKSLASAVAEKNKEIAVRDEKLSRLKSQMADAMRGSSWERQQQLDELTKELSRTQEECDMMRMKMKAIQRSANNPNGKLSSIAPCTNCSNLTQKLNSSEKLVSEKTASVRELKSLCARFEKQLKQQDELLKQWALSKGHKI